MCKLPLLPLLLILPAEVSLNRSGLVGSVYFPPVKAPSASAPFRGFH